MKKWLVIIITVVFAEAVSDIFAKEWSLRSHWWIFAIAISGYIITNLFWLYALKNGADLARGAVLFSAGSAILGVMSGLILYKEILTPIQLLGVFLGIISLVLLLWE